MQPYGWIGLGVGGWNGNGAPAVSYTLSADAGSLTITGSAANLSVSSSPLQLANVTDPTMRDGEAYSDGFVASLGQAPYTYSIVSGVLPTGLTLGSSDGTLTGTPTQYGDFTVTCRVTDDLGAIRDTVAPLVSVFPETTIPATPTILREVYVDLANTAGPWDGTLANPWETIQDAMDDALNGDRINIAEGTYDPFAFSKAVTDLTIEGAIEGIDGRPVVKIRPALQASTWTSAGNDVWYSTDFANGVRAMAWGHLDTIDFAAQQNLVDIQFIGPDVTDNSTDQVYDDGLINTIFNVDTGTDVYHQLFQGNSGAPRPVDYDGGEGIIFWECFKACAYQDRTNDRVYLRFADGRDPNDLDIFVWDDTLNLLTTYPYNFAGLHLKNLRFSGGWDQAELRTNALEDTANCTVEGCVFSGYSRNGCRLWAGEGYHILNCEFYGGNGWESTGAWGGGAADRDSGNREVAYEFNKYAWSDNDSSEHIAISGFYNSETIVDGCRFIGGMQAINCFSVAGTENGLENEYTNHGSTYRNNFISGMSSLGILYMPNQIRLEIHSNEIWNCNSQIRSHRMTYDYPLDVYVHNNLMVLAYNQGTQKFLHTQVGETFPNDARHAAWYNNTMEGSQYALGITNAHLDADYNIVEHENWQNNIIDGCVRVIETELEDPKSESYGLFDYNYTAGNLQNSDSKVWWGNNNISVLTGSATTGIWGDEPRSLIIPGGHPSLTVSGDLPGSWPNPSSNPVAGDPAGCDLITWSLQGRNILPDSLNMTAASWVTDGLSSFAADVTVKDPWGGTRAYKAINDTTELTTGYCAVGDANILPADNDGAWWIYSCYVKPDPTMAIDWGTLYTSNRNDIVTLSNRSVNSSQPYYIMFNLTTCDWRVPVPQTHTGRFQTGGIEKCNYGWYRIWGARQNYHEGAEANFDDFYIHFVRGVSGVWDDNGSLAFVPNDYPELRYWVCCPQLELAVGSMRTPTPWEEIPAPLQASSDDYASSDKLASLGPN